MDHPTALFGEPAVGLGRLRRRSAAVIVAFGLLGAACSSASTPETLAAVPDGESGESDTSTVVVETDNSQAAQHGAPTGDQAAAPADDVADRGGLDNPELFDLLVSDDAEDAAAAGTDDEADAGSTDAGSGDAATDVPAEGLDAPAVVACQHIDEALSSIDSIDLGVAATGIVEAAEWAEQSEVAAIRDRAPTLTAVAEAGSVTEIGILIAFLATCADEGYEV